MTRLLAHQPTHLAPIAPGAMPDRFLLDLFLTERDEEAFEILVMRHGPRVLRICRQWLGDGQDAEDACQATFVVLVNRGGEIRHTGSISGWLCGVARRVAGRAKMRADRRRKREGGAVDIHEIADRNQPATGDLRPLLQAEIDRLPAKYRQPIELCYWEGLSSEQAASRLRCPTGTVKWRLSRAREILRDRLVRVGITLAAFWMWRIPSADASGDPGYLRKGRNVGDGMGKPGDEALPAKFVKDTVELAAFVRDMPLTFMKIRASRVEGRRKLPRVIPLIVIFAMVVAYLRGIPAIGRTSMPPASGSSLPATKHTCHGR